MLVAAFLLICSIPQMDDVAKDANGSRVAEQPNASSKADPNDSKEPAEPIALPSAPTPKVKTDAEAILPNASGQPFQPSKPAFTRPQETHRQRIMWYGLTAAGHAGAAFDAWSTRRAVSGGFGHEANPLLRPFANSNSLYAVTQVSPAILDFLGKRMMVSRHPSVRKVWWVPQAVGASLSFAAGAHNVGVVH